MGTPLDLLPGVSIGLVLETLDTYNGRYRSPSYFYTIPI